MRYPEIKSLPLNPGLEDFSRLDVNIPYSAWICFCPGRTSTRTYWAR